MKRYHTFIIILLVAILFGYWYYTKNVKSDQAEERASVALIVSEPDRKAVESTTEETVVTPLIASEPSGEAIGADVPASDLPILLGVIISKNTKSAILENQLTGITGTYNIKESFEGYFISEIEQRMVVLLKDNEKFEIYLRDVKDIQYNTTPLVATPTFKRPSRPIAPGREGSAGIPGIESQGTSEKVELAETSDEDVDSQIHKRFKRRPVHEEFGTPLTPTPPVPATFD